jgi:hypothetical protein
MNPSTVILVVFPITLRVFYMIVRLLSNIRTARHTGLPYTISFIHELETWAYLTDPLFRWAFRSRILRGRGWPRWARFAVKDWHYEDRRRAHDEHGPVFLVVSPGGMVCYVGDADTAAQVLTRRKAFIKPPEKMSQFPSCFISPSHRGAGAGTSLLIALHRRLQHPSPVIQRMQL